MYSLNHLIQDLLQSSVTTNPLPRKEIWASDLGKPFVDRYLEMKGYPYTNPSTGSGLHNFVIGKSIEEGYIKTLKMCMLPGESQLKVVTQRKNCLPVSGRPDLVIEIKDWDEIENKVIDSIDQEMKKIEETKTEDVMVYDFDAKIVGTQKYPLKSATNKIIEKRQSLLNLLAMWKLKYPGGFPKRTFEIKSIALAAMKFNKTKGLTNAYPHYVLQLYHYMIGMDLDEGTLIFVVKDMGKNAGWCEEVVIKRNQEWEDKYWNDIQGFSKFYLNGTEPPKENIIVDGKKNWRVTYSRYFDRLYKKEVDAHDLINPPVIKKTRKAIEMVSEPAPKEEVIKGAHRVITPNPPPDPVGGNWGTAVPTPVKPSKKPGTPLPVGQSDSLDPFMKKLLSKPKS